MSRKNTICFVCTGNTCRSPMAQYILKSKLSDAENLDVRICSYGTDVTDERINELAKSTLKAHGIKLTKFTPKQITVDKVKGFGAIVTMTDKMMEKLILQGYTNVYSINQLTALGDVFDPYGMDMSAYEKCYLQLDKACDILLSMLLKVI